MPHAPRVVLATTNPNKVVELAELLAEVAGGIEVLPRPAGMGDVDETGETFAANAELKAVAVARATGQWALADDSGLEVDALAGAPGVRSARYAADLGGADLGAEQADEGVPVEGAVADVDAVNRRALLGQLAGRRLPSPARFRCALALADPNGAVRLRTEGTVEGGLVGEERGEGGFGYDPLFVPREGGGATFAQLSRAEKAALSHRGRALRALVEQLRAEAGRALLEEMADIEGR
ncbi:MAG: RdgB/HAM1 family non-canonical purine NTP pyrophosphatase [Microthrixaceae bacterium]